MTAHVVYRVLGPKQIKQLQEVYERALSVRAKLPESHLASIAAKNVPRQRLCPRFEVVI
jgi:hypothetical protein